MDYMIKGDTLTDIADAIRSKKGSSSSILTENMASEILTIPSGGSSVLISKSITQNGIYNAQDDGADGYDEVTVNVQGGGGKIIVDDLIEYPYPSNNTNVIYSSQIAAQSAAYKAFVPDVAQYWTGSGATNNFIGWKFSTPQVVNFYEIWSRNQGNQYDYLQAPKEWILQGSNDDGETWTDIDEQDFTFTAGAEKWSSAVSNTTAYKWYRIFVITARDTANDTCIGYIDFKHAYIEEPEETENNGS